MDESKDKIPPIEKRELRESKETADSMTSRVANQDADSPTLDNLDLSLRALMQERYEVDVALEKLSHPRRLLQNRSELSGRVAQAEEEIENEKRKFTSIIKKLSHPLAYTSSEQSIARVKRYISLLQEKLEQENLHFARCRKEEVTSEAEARDWDQAEVKGQALEERRAELTGEIKIIEKVFAAARSAPRVREYREDKIGSSSGKRLAYRAEFKEAMKEYGGVIAKVLDMLTKVSSPTMFVMQEGVLVERLYHTRYVPYPDIGKRKGRTDAFKVTLPRGRRYFLKVQNKVGRAYFGGGFSQIRDARAIEVLLAEIPNVRVINYQLGYEDTDKAYLVAEWMDDLGLTREELDEYIENLEKKNQHARAEELKKMKADFLAKLAEIKHNIKHMDESGYAWEFTQNNWTYNPETGMFTLFDIGGKSPVRLSFEARTSVVED